MVNEFLNGALRSQVCYRVVPQSLTCKEKHVKFQCRRYEEEQQKTRKLLICVCEETEENLLCKANSTQFVF